MSEDDITSGLLERAHELDTIADGLARACDGTGQLIVVEGVAGAGKTSLLRATSEVARVRGMRALAARGLALEGDFAFGVARQLFLPVLRDEAEAAELFAGPAGLVRPLLEGSASTAPGDGEFPFLHGFFWLLGNLAERAPVLLTIDDAHWADAPSLRALLYLLHRLEEVPVCFVVAIREGEPGAPHELLTELKSDPLARVLRPEPLSPEAVERIVAGRLGRAEPAFAQACVAVSGGNPFLLSELLAALTAEQVEPTVAGAERVRRLVPERVLASTLVRLSRLDADATALARALAVLDGRKDLELVSSLAGVDAQRAASAADALAAAGIVTVDPWLQFAHPLLRSAVYTATGPAERARMHVEAARQLADRAADPHVVAAQLLLGERAGDRWTVEALRRAARVALAEGAAASAARYLERALDEPPAPPLISEITADLASAEVAAGRPEAIDRLRTAIEAVDDPRHRTQLRLALASALDHHGRHLDAASVLQAGVLEVRGEARELELELTAAWTSVARLDPSLRAQAMPELARLASGLTGATRVERTLLANEANRRVFAGDPRDEVLELLDRAWAGGKQIDDWRSGGVAPLTAISTVGWCDAFDLYEERARAIQTEAQRRGLILSYADATYCLHLSHHFRGRLADAVADAEIALGAVRYGWRRHLPTACSQLAWTLIELEDLDGAERVLERPELAQAEGTLAYMLVHDARGRLAAARGQPHAALEEFLHAGRIADTAPLVNPSYLPWRSSAAVAAARIGRLDQARELADEELRRAERFAAPRPLGIAQRARALIEGGDATIEGLRTAVATLADSPARLEHARALIDLGAALRRNGWRREARTPLGEGLELVIGFGALALEHRAREELVAAGVRPRRRRFSGVDALTPSERRVAEMAASGMTNREIAEALFVTMKAVQWHLGNAYRKVGVAKREELAAVLHAA